jgi:hypothetical protein
MKEKTKGARGERAAREKRIAAPEETADLRFRESGQTSPYRDLFEDLQDAPNGSTLKIAKQARYTALKHIRALGLKVLWGKKGEDLYIKIVGEVAETDRPLTVERVLGRMAGEKAPATRSPALPGTKGERLILEALANGPCTLKEVAGLVGLTKIGAAAVLTEMMTRGLLECEDDCYRLKSSGRAA